MRTPLLPLLLVSIIPCLAPGTLRAADESPVTLRNTEQFQLKSATGAEYSIAISKPLGKTPPDGHGVVYVIDGGDNFPIMAKISERHGRYASIIGRDNGLIVVGIDYPETDLDKRRNRRSFDLTSAAPDDKQPKHPKFPDPMPSGGQDAFFEFIQTKLKPEIGKRFKVDPKRQALWGHSFGGLFTLHVLFTQPEAFQIYFAVSPSIWWNGMSILEEEKAFTKKGGAKVDLILMAGGRESPHMARDTGHMARRLEPLNANGLGLYHIEFAEEDHGTVVAPALNRSLVFLTEGTPR